MRILFCLTHFKPDLAEAISKTAVATARRIATEGGCRITFAVPEAPKYDVFDGTSIDVVAFEGPKNYASRVRAVSTIWALRALIKNRAQDHDVLVFHVGIPLELFLLRAVLPKTRVPWVAIVWQPYTEIGEWAWSLRRFGRHAALFIQHMTVNAWLSAPLIMLGIRAFARVIVSSRHQLDQLVGWGGAGRVRVLANPVVDDAEGLAKGIITPPRSGGYRVLYLGHATPAKGLDTLCLAIKPLAASMDIRLTLALSSFATVNVHTLINNNGLSQIVDMKDRVVVADEMRAHDIVVLPHNVTAGTSCFSAVALEAFANGVCVVACATAPMRELLDDGTRGYLTPPGDAAAMTAILRTALTDKSGRAERAANARAYVSKAHDLKAYSNQLVREFVDVAEGIDRR